MPVVGHPYGYHYVPGSDIEVAAKRFLQPELLQGHFAASFNLLFEFACLLGLFLYSGFHSAMLEFNLGAHGPAMTEIVAQHDDGMRKIDPRIAFGIGIAFGMRIAEYIVRVEMTAENCLAVASYGKAVLGAGSVVLCGNSGRQQQHSCCINT